MSSADKPRLGAVNVGDHLKLVDGVVRVRGTRLDVARIGYAPTHYDLAPDVCEEVSAVWRVLEEERRTAVADYREEHGIGEEHGGAYLTHAAESLRAEADAGDDPFRSMMCRHAADGIDLLFGMHDAIPPLVTAPRLAWQAKPPTAENVGEWWIGHWSAVMPFVIVGLVTDITRRIALCSETYVHPIDETHTAGMQWARVPLPEEKP